MLTETELFHLASAERFADAVSERLVTPNARATRFDLEEARNHLRRLARMLRDIELSASCSTPINRRSPR